MSTEWMNRANCRFVYRFTELEPSEAKAYCRSGCPVTVQCLLHLKEFRGLNDLVVSGYPIVYGGMTPSEVVGAEIKCIHGRKPSCGICDWRKDLIEVAEGWEGSMLGLAVHLKRPVSTVRQSLRRWSPFLFDKIVGQSDGVLQRA